MNLLAPRAALVALSLKLVLLSGCSIPTSLTQKAESPIAALPTESLSSDELASPSSSPPEVAIDHEQAASAIRTFIGSPDIALAFQEITTMANSPDADLLVATYSDDWGAIYSVDSSYRVVEFQASPIRSQPGESLALERIRQIAENLAGAAVPGFDQIRVSLQYEEGEKEGVFFFRWEDSSRQWKYNPPIFQVGIQGDGRLLTYINTILLP